MLLSIFLISFYVRQPFFKDFATINIMFLSALGLYIILNYKKIDYFKFIYISIIGIYIFIIDYLGNKNSITTILRNLSMIIMPLYLLTIKINKFEFKEIIINILKILNLFIIIIFIIGIVDPIINFSIMKFFGEYLTPELSKWINKNTTMIGYRYTSYMGHPLFTKELFIYFFALNNAYYHKFKEQLLNKYLLIVISLVGVLLTGSKSGIMLIMVCILANVILEKNILSIISSFLIVTTTYFVGLFNNVILRLQSGSLTTGRAEGWEYIEELGFLKKQFFLGYGENLSVIVSNVVGKSIATAGLEYPLRILLYKYGIVCMLMISSIIFIYPLIHLIKNKEFYLLFILSIKIVDVNLYNGLIFKADNMIMYILFVYLLIGLSNIKINNKDMEKICNEK